MTMSTNCKVKPWQICKTLCCLTLWLGYVFHGCIKKREKKERRKKKEDWKLHLDAISLAQVNSTDISASLLSGTG